MDVPSWLYERIYGRSGVIPGYTRYKRYARAVKRQRSPLMYLAEQESVYRYVLEYLRREGSPITTIIELGCGQGYLTYALRKAGYDCIGVDISQTAVQAARKKFRHPEWFMTVNEFGPGSADLVVALELIEHVPDPVGLVDDALALTKDTGSVLLTTPNRDAAPPNTLWDSDLPPVHLYWFGVSAMTAVAYSLGASISFLSHPADGGVAKANRADPLRGPLFDDSGGLLQVGFARTEFGYRAMSAMSSRLRQAGELLDPVRRTSLRGIEEQPPSADETLAAVIRRGPERVM